MFKVAKYTDEWVEDSVLINSLTAGGCSCCALPAFTSSLSSLIAECSDLDSDGRAGSLDHSLHHTVWPQEITEAIWQSRVRFRSGIKSQSKHYQSLASNPAFIEFLTNMDNQHYIIDCFSFTMQHVHQQLKQFPLATEYLSLLHLLLTQVFYFRVTLMKSDGEGVTQPEIAFARSLGLDDSGGGGDSEVLTVSEDYAVLPASGVVDRLRESYGPILPKQSSEAKIDTHTNTNHDIEGRAVSFRNDRRLLRLLIFRMGIERLWGQFQSTTDSTSTANGAGSVSDSNVSQ